eukprot:Rmarinus@m.2414
MWSICLLFLLLGALTNTAGAISPCYDSLLKEYCVVGSTPFLTLNCTGYGMMNPYVSVEVSLGMGYLASAKYLNEYGEYEVCTRFSDVAQHCIIRDSATTLGYGMCVPRGCEPDEVHAFFQAATAPTVTLQTDTVSCGENKESNSDSLYLVGASFFVVAASGCVLATLYDFTYPSATSAFVQWSIPRNLSRLQSVRFPAKRFAVLNGIRVLSTTWVILVHSYNYAFTIGYSNVIDVLPPGGVSSQMWFQPVLSGLLSVDSFFFSGGFLCSMSLMKRLENNAPLAFSRYAMHRIVRVCLPFFAVFFFFVSIFSHLASGPFWFLAIEEVEKCDSDWIYNVLFINNWFTGKASGTECFDHAWYLANDLQFYLVSPLFVILYVRRSRTAAYAAVLATLAVSYAVTGYTMVHYDLSPSVFMLPDTEYANMIYKKPYIRIQTWLLGILTHFIVLDLDAYLQCRRRKEALSSGPVGGDKDVAGGLAWLPNGQSIVCGMYVFSFALMGTAAFGTYGLYQDVDPEWSQARSMFFEMFWSTCWTVGLAMFCVLCFYEHGSFLGEFLGAPMWMPFTRLSYCIYLIHPLVIFAVYFSLRTQLSYTDWSFLERYAGIVLMSVIVAVPFHLIFDSPSGTVEKVFWKYVDQLTKSDESEGRVSKLEEIPYSRLGTSEARGHTETPGSHERA